ncbi:MAG: endopeptidase La [Erysipelotrichaceae bacterium]|nr:endopeptidase La [Erysipelotrichaceae bacterium]MDY6035081.1 endopeptidase La [Bulleidia sp.]
MAIIVPIYNTVLLPETTIYLTTDSYKNATGEEPSVGERVIFAIERKALSPDDFRPENFYPLGVSGTITEVNTNGFVVIKTEARINIEDLVVHSDKSLEVLSVIRKPATNDLDPSDEKRRVEQLKSALIKATENYQWALGARNFINQLRGMEDIISAMAQWLNISDEEKYAFLEENSRANLLNMIEKYIYEYTEMTDVTNEASAAQENDNKKAYREMAIKKQIEYLQKELDDMHPENVTDIRKMEMKIQSSGMNETARREADKVLSRLKQEGSNSPEYGNLYNYLDFMTSLNWKKERTKKIDFAGSEKVLDEDHYGLKKVKERILQQIAVMDLNKRQSGSILLFVGAPGTGKTSIGKSIAEALKRKYVRVALGGVRDEADIRGHRRTYIGAMPGRIMDGIQKAGTSNPVMVLDEIDKLSSSYNGDPASALLEVLDPEQNNTFTDHYMNVPYDLSDVLFICTANTLDSIPEPLLNRMEVIDFQGYTASEKFQIAKQHLIPKAIQKMGIPEDQIELTDDAIRSIISDYTMEGGVRGLKKRIDTIFRAVAVKFARGQQDKMVIQADELPTLLDLKPIHHEKLTEQKNPGIVTGLAWTASGGEILFIETLLTKGSGQLIVTGQLGDVMKESVRIALSLVKAKFPEADKILKTHDVHIHVPQGAVKKDGPSAGITLTTALASLITKKKVSPLIAMTGEVSLRGGVMPIGGLPEKLMAAARAGVKTVYIPKENEDDLKDVAEEVKQKLKIVPVDKIDDVLKATGVLAKTTTKKTSK